MTDPLGSSIAIAANRAAWDATAPLHHGNAMWQRLASGFATPGYSCFDPVMRAALEDVGLTGKDVAQVCCNNGRETISLRNLGARWAVGFDHSAAFLDQARELNDIAGQDCLFVMADATALPASYRARFDLVVITIGVFGWMPDLARFMREATGLIRPGGRLLIYEEHPVVNMFEPRGLEPLKAVHSYFRDQPFQSREAILYDDSLRPEVPQHYWFVHPLSSVITTILATGLRLELFREFGSNISSTEFDALETEARLLPMSYLLRAIRE